MAQRIRIFFRLALIYVYICRLTGKCDNVIIIAKILLCSAVARIAVAPTSQNVIEGSDAVFHCSGTDIVFLTWFINEDLIHNEYNEDIRVNTMQKDDLLYSSLRILTLPKYNASSIRCVHHLDSQNNNVEQFEAHLHIQGNIWL